MSSCVGVLQGAHALIAIARDEQHWLLNDGDAKVYGQALSNALRHLPMAATQKSIDFMMLFVCAVNMETPRFYASRMKAKQKREARPAATVYPFAPMGPDAGQELG